MNWHRLLLVSLIAWLPLATARAAAPEGDMYYLGLALDQQGVRGGWGRIGPEAGWKNTLAGGIVKGRLYTAENDGTLQMTNLDTGERTPIGKNEFGNTAFMFAAGDTLYTIETTGNLFRVNPADGTWVQIGKEGDWKDVLAGVICKGQLYTAERNGTLVATDLGTGQRKVVGNPDFAATSVMFTDGGTLYTIETSGTLYRVDPTNGAWAGVGPEGAWKTLRAGTILKGQVYTAEADGTLRTAKLTDGQRKQVGKPDFGNTKFMFPGDDPIYTIETDGSLYVVHVQPPVSIYAYDCFPKEFEKAFREQGKAYYRNIDTQLILGEHATHAGIVGGLDWLRSKATRRDKVVIYLTCHGGVDANEGWGIETADGSTFWGHDLKAELAKLPCNALVFIETCASGGFAQPHKNDPPVPPNVTVFCACSGGQSIDNQLDIAALEGLYGRADFNHDGVVEVDELIQYVKSRYKEWWPVSKAGGEGVYPVMVRAKSMPGTLAITRVSPELSAIDFNGTMWSALLEKHDGDQYHVHLLGWNSVPGKPYFLTNDVTRDNICLPDEGSPLSVEQKGTWYPARLIAKVGDKYKVHYLGYHEEEVVTRERIKYPFVGKPE